MQVNLSPSKEVYLAARKDLAYLLVLLATGLICLLPVGYTIAKYVSLNMNRLVTSVIVIIYHTVYNYSIAHSH